jgi:hypothetical protein
VKQLNWFGRQCLAWPAAMLGGLLTDIAYLLLAFAAWIMDFDDSLEGEGE